MKPIILLTAVFICFATLRIVAQSPDETKIQILRTDQPDVIRVVYAKEIKDHVTVTFRTTRGNVARDRIKGNDLPKGFSKRYNVCVLNRQDFWIEITSPEMTAIYRIVPQGDGERFTSHLEKTIYNHRLVATR